MQGEAMEKWLFDQAPNVAAVTSQSVIDGAPILLVVHYSDDHSWAFLDGADLKFDDGRVVSMKTIVALDPSLAAIADLPPGWVAQRASADAGWATAFDPEC
jgi:hypothetical protein